MKNKFLLLVAFVLIGSAIVYQFFPNTLQGLKSDTSASNPNLVAHWTFDEINGYDMVEDMSGHENNGQLYRDLGAGFMDHYPRSYSPDPVLVPGKMGNTIMFDSMTVPFPQNLRNAQSITLSAWIRPLGTGYDRNYEYHTPIVILRPRGYGVGLGYDDGQVRFYKSIGTEPYPSGSDAEVTSFYSNTDINMADGQWHHVAATFDGSFMKIYLDGILVGEKEDHNALLLEDSPVSSDPARPDPGQIYVGADKLRGDELSHLTYPDERSNPFAGLIDDVQIYKIPLTDVQIGTLFQEGNNATPHSLFSSCDPANPHDYDLFVSEGGKHPLLWNTNTKKFGDPCVLKDSSKAPLCFEKETYEKSYLPPMPIIPDACDPEDWASRLASAPSDEVRATWQALTNQYGQPCRMDRAPEVNECVQTVSLQAPTILCWWNKPQEKIVLGQDEICWYGGKRAPLDSNTIDQRTIGEVDEQDLKAGHGPYSFTPPYAIQEKGLSTMEVTVLQNVARKDARIDTKILQSLPSGLPALPAESNGPFLILQFTPAEALAQALESAHITVGLGTDSDGKIQGFEKQDIVLATLENGAWTILPTTHGYVSSYSSVAGSDYSVQHTAIAHKLSYLIAIQKHTEPSAGGIDEPGIPPTEPPPPPGGTEPPEGTFPETGGPGKITIKKDTVPDSDAPFSFIVQDLANDGSVPVGSAMISDNGMESIENLALGSYEIKENSMYSMGYALTDISCDHSPGDPDAINIPANTIKVTLSEEDPEITCTFTNKKSSRLFVSAETMPANFGGAKFADSLCRSSAINAGLMGVNWKAIVSDKDRNAKDVIPEDVVFVRLPCVKFDSDDQHCDAETGNLLVAENKVDLLDGSILEPVTRTQFGYHFAADSSLENDGESWTGSELDGVISDETCEDWTKTDAEKQGDTGDASKTDTAFLARGNDTCDQIHPVFCVETFEADPIEAETIELPMAWTDPDAGDQGNTNEPFEVKITVPEDVRPNEPVDIEFSIKPKP